METGGDADDLTSRGQHQHFLWCTLNKSPGTMHGPFVAMVTGGFFVFFFPEPCRRNNLGEMLAAGAENVALMNPHQKHSGS